MPWKFYGRSLELECMRKLLTAQHWFFCAISGRRRIGKTSLIRESLQTLPEAQKALYLQVPGRDERDVVAVFVDALQAASHRDLPADVNPASLHRFAEMARAIAVLCRAGWVVILDEFQYFNRKSLSAFASLLQAEVDTLTGSSTGGIFVLGSIHTEMIERNVRKLMAEASRRAVGDFALTDIVTGYWNRPRDAQRLIETDIVAINETDKVVRFGNCKGSETRHTSEALDKTAQHIQDFLATATGKRFKGWKQQRALYAPVFGPDRRAHLTT